MLILNNGVVLEPTRSLHTYIVWREHVAASIPSNDDRELLLYSKYHINMMFVYEAVCGVVNVIKELYRDD